MKKKVLVFCLFLALVISTTLIFQHPQTANASTLNFDTYTDSDYFLNSTNPNETIQKYKDNYFANKLTLPSSTFPHQIVPSNGYTANEDDDIIRIVPRELFNTIGTTLHIGIEYGFFISVSDHYEYGKRATVLVFDIKNENFGPDIISTTVKPLFCNNYYYLSRVNNFQFDIYSVTPLFGSTRHPRNLTVSNPSVNNIIIPEPTYREYYGWEYRTNDNYYLNDVTFVSYLTNEQHLNPHQPGYNARNDDGMFYHHSQVQFSAVQRDKEEWDWAEFGGLLKDTGTFALGVLFPESLIVDVSTKLVDFISLAIDGSTFYNSPLYFKDINNEIIFSSTNESTKEAQLASFNPGQTPYLSKESVLKLKCAHPVLLGVSNYATATHYTGTTKVWNTRYNSGIGLSIAYVNGNDFVNVISGKGHSSRIVEDREREELQFNAINSRVISVSPQFTTTNSQKINGLNKYSIKPEYSGKYIIEMWNPLTLVPPIVEIKNHYTNQIVDYTFESIDGIRYYKFYLNGGRLPNNEPLYDYEINFYNVIPYVDAIWDMRFTLECLTSPLNSTYTLNNGSSIIGLKVNENSIYKIGITQNSNLSIEDIMIRKIDSYGNYIFDTEYDVNKNLLGTNRYEVQTSLTIDKIYYLLIKNTGTTTNFNINASHITDSITESSNIYLNTKNNIKYYKFTAPANKTYIFSATAPSSSQALTVKLCDNNGVKKGIETTFSNGASAKVKLIQNEVIYFGISSLSPINNVSLQVQSEENTYYWFYGENENEQNNILYNDVLSIPRGKTYYIYLKQKTNYGFFEGDYVYENYVNSSVGTYTNKRIEIKSNSVLNSDSFIKAKDEYGELANLYFNVRYENNITFDLVNNKSITLNWDKNKCPDIKEVECAIIMPGKADYIFTITNAKFQTNSWIFMTESGNPDANAILYNSYFDSLAFPYNVTFKVNKIVLNNNSEVSNTEYTLSSKNFNVSFDSGEGTASNPFVVRTIRHLNNITRALNRYYIQAEMINFNYATPATTGYYFSGNYNGNNYFIHSPSVNIAVSSTFKEVGCLFAGNSGTLRNIKLGTPRITSASDTTGVYNVGGFVGFNNGTVDNCSITLSNFTVNKLHGYTGGIVGYNNGTIISTRMYGTVLANNNVGGVAGVNHGTIASCNSETNVNLYQIGANNRAAGGVAGVNFGTIRNCIITLSVSYVSPRDTNKDIAPCLGLIAGQQASNNQGQVYSNTVQNTINTGELIKYGGIFGIGAYDQKKYVGGNFGRLI